MRAFAPKRKLSRLAAALVVLLGLFLAGGHAAKADDTEQPVNVIAISNAPRVVTVYWTHSGDGVFQFDIEEKTTGGVTTVACPCGSGQNQKSIGNLQPNTKYQFRVCADYDANDTNRVCSDANNVGYYPVTTGVDAGQTANMPPSLPIILNIDAGFDQNGNASMGVHWETNGDSYDSYTVRQRVKAAPGAADNLFQDEDSKASGSTGFHAVNGLLPGTTYQFQVRGCYKDFFVITDCQDWGPLYEATTLQLANASNRPTPSVFSGGSTETSISISWSVTPRYSYDHYVIQYHSQPAGGGAPGATVTDQVQGNQVNYTAQNLTSGTAYVFTVQGCDLILMPTPGVDCAGTSAQYQATTTTPLVTGGGTLAPATISVASPTITAGNSVTVTGQLFPPNDGTVSLGYSYSGSTPTGGVSGGSGTLGTATLSNQGTFSTTITLPSSVPATSVKITASSKTANAETTVQVVAPSSKGTLTITWAGQVYTSIGTDSPFTLNGANFTPGTVTIYLDSQTGLQLGTATVGADGTFKQDLQVNADQIGNKGGQHKLVVVQNGTVQAQATYPFELPEVIH